jgi:ceramide glucosyltransferase
VWSVVERRTVARAVDRQVRWGMIRHAFSRTTFAGEILLNPLVLSVAAAFGATAASLPATGLLASLAMVTLLARLLQASILGRLTGQPLAPATLATMPLKDVLQLWSLLVPFFAREVCWHGSRARVGPGTRLLPLEDVAAA